MNSAEDICNLALGHLGVEAITDLNNTDKVSVTCNTFYLPALKYVLGQHFWNFAMTRAQLSKDVDAPLFEWGSQFSLPSDFLLLYGTSPKKFDYEIEGQKLLCNQTNLYIKYVRFFTNVANFDPAFVKALGLQLAMDMAWDLTQSNTREQQLNAKYQEVIRNAKATDAISAPINELIDDTFLDSRVSGPGYGRY